MKSYKNAAFTLIMLGLITAPAAILAMEAFDDVAMQQSLTNRNGNNNYNTDDDDAFLNSSEYLPSEFYGEDWNDIYLTPPPPTCTNLEDLGKDLDKLEDFESYDEFQKRLSNASLHAVTNDAHTNASPTATPPTTPKSSVTQYIPSQREVTLTAGVLATIAYGVQQAPAAVLRKIAIDTDITRNGSAGSLGAAFTQAFLNFVEAFGLPAVILGSFSAMYWEVRKIERCEVQNKEMTRKLNTQDEYIKRLSGGIKKHDIAFHQVVE